MKNHIKKFHQDKKFKCNYCTFEGDRLALMYEHRLENHSESPHDYTPKQTTTVKDMILNLIAEQNLEIMEELKELKKGVKVSFEEVKSNLKDATKSAFEAINVRVNNLEKARDNLPKEKAKSTAPPPASSVASDTLSSGRPSMKKKKTVFLKKPKVLYIGDSIAHNTNFKHLENETDSRIRTRKAYSAVEDLKARFPHKNVAEITKVALTKTHKDDDFSHLVLAAPSVDITNLDTTKLSTNENIEVYKQKVYISCQNILTAAENAINCHPQLQKVVITEHAPRFDANDMDPTGLKPKLAKYANSVFTQLWHSSALKTKIAIGRHSLDCGGDQLAARFRDERTGRYDGVHMYGSQGFKTFTDSMLQIITSVFPSSSPSPSSSFHTTCPQAKYQKRQTSKSSGQQKSSNVYNVPVHNLFDVLGN